MAVFFEEPGITCGNVYPIVLDVPFKGDFPLPRLNAGKGKSVNTVVQLMYGYPSFRQKTSWTSWCTWHRHVCFDFLHNSRVVSAGCHVVVSWKMSKNIGSTHITIHHTYYITHQYMSDYCHLVSLSRNYSLFFTLRKFHKNQPETLPSQRLDHPFESQVSLMAWGENKVTVSEEKILESRLHLSVDSLLDSLLDSSSCIRLAPWHWLLGMIPWFDVIRCSKDP